MARPSRQRRSSSWRRPTIVSLLMVWMWIFRRPSLMHIERTIDDSSIAASASMAIRPPAFRIPPNAHPHMNPVVGRHRSNANAIMAMATGYGLSDLMRFVDSLMRTGYQGDLVLGVHWKTIEADLRSYLQSVDHMVIVYDIDVHCQTVRKQTTCQIQSLYYDEDHTIRNDPRDFRPMAQLRFEYYWLWTQYYPSTSQILLLDARDSYFQQDPFRSSTVSSATLHVFDEGRIKRIGTQYSNAHWLKQAHGEEALELLKDKPVLCSGTILGSPTWLLPYLEAMVHADEVHPCPAQGCDQGHHNFIVYSRPEESYVAHRSGHNPILFTLGQHARNAGATLRQQGIFVNQTVWNLDGSTQPAIVHQFDRDVELNAFMENRTHEMVANWKQQQQRKT